MARQGSHYGVLFLHECVLPAVVNNKPQGSSGEQVFQLNGPTCFLIGQSNMNPITFHCLNSCWISSWGLFHLNYSVLLKQTQAKRIWNLMTVHVFKFIASVSGPSLLDSPLRSEDSNQNGPFTCSGLCCNVIFDVTKDRIISPGAQTFGIYGCHQKVFCVSIQEREMNWIGGGRRQCRDDELRWEGGGGGVGGDEKRKAILFNGWMDLRIRLNNKGKEATMDFFVIMDQEEWIWRERSKQSYAGRMIQRNFG